METKMTMISKRFRNSLVRRTLNLSLAGIGVGWVAWGANYNFYFNNTEQGPNSTATPTLSVVDGKSNGTATSIPVAAPSPGPAPADNSVAASAGTAPSTPGNP